MEVTKHTKGVHRTVPLSNLAIFSPSCSTIHASHLWCGSVLLLKFFAELIKMINCSPVYSFSGCAANKFKSKTFR